MSTSYISQAPMTINEALERSGWIRSSHQESGSTILITDGHNFAHIGELTACDGTTHVEFTRYGANNVESLVDDLDMWSEHDEEYFGILGIGTEE